MICMEDRSLMVIGIDHGYGNIKTAHTATRTGIVRYDSEPVFAGKVLEYEGKYYRFGEGHKEFIADKSQDDEFYLFTLIAIARELDTQSLSTANVYLAAGLPLTWVRAQRNSFRDYLMRNDKVIFRYNGRQYRIHFAGCVVYPQGYPAIISRLNNSKGLNMLADIGNGTMNIMYIAGRKPVESKCWTEKYGVNQCIIAAQNAVMDNFGVKIDEPVIEQVLRNGATDIGEKYLNCITQAARVYTSGIFSVLRKYEYNPDIMNLTIVGGGGCLIRNFGEYDQKRVTIIADICATAKGYELLAAASLRRKEQE